MCLYVLFPNSKEENLIDLAYVKYPLLLQKAVAAGRSIQRSGMCVISYAPFILWTAQVNYPRKSGRMKETLILIPRFQFYRRG